MPTKPVEILQLSKYATELSTEFSVIFEFLTTFLLTAEQFL